MSEDWDVLPLAARIDLVRGMLDEFGARHISLVGDEMHHSCVLPFGLHRHGDVNPSASINVRSLTMNCFVCAGGSFVWWVATCRGTTTGLARQWLERKKGPNDLNLSDLLAYFDSIYNPAKAKHEPLPVYSERVLEPWKLIHPYLTERRRIPPKTIKHFKVGFNPETNRIVLPHFWEGKLVGWQTRRLVNDGTPKFLFTTGFPKKDTVFNYQPTAPVVVVEAVMSVLSKWHISAIPIETTFSASVTEHQARLLSSHPRVILFYDNDNPGWKATEFLGRYLSKYTDVRVVENPYLADPADMTDADYVELVNTAIPFGAWHRPSKVIAYEAL